MMKATAPDGRILAGLALASIHKQQRNLEIEGQIVIVDDETGEAVGWSTLERFGPKGTEPDAT
jgi:hypothetical protein